MRRRKERIRKGLEIDFDLIDSDVMRWHFRDYVNWSDGPRPLLVWVQSADKEDWAEGDDSVARIMTRTLDNPTELAEGRRMLRLLRYKSYACLEELASRKPEKGEFVIRKPPISGVPYYVTEVDEEKMTVGLADPDRVGFYEGDSNFYQSDEVEDAQRYTHAEAVRLTIRIMLDAGYEIPDDHGDYWEPIRYDVAEELHRRAMNRPHLRSHLETVKNDVSREP